MRPVLIICLILFCCGCSTTPSEPVIKPHSSVAYESASHRYSRMQNSTAIDQRAKHYERDGLSPDDARTAAEIEYAKSGR